MTGPSEAGAHHNGPMHWNDALAEQFAWHWEHHLRPRMAGLTDAEYHWEPVDGCWGVRHVDDTSPSTVTIRSGAGDWRCEYAWPAPDPAPVTTIAWRLAHLVVGVFGMRNHSYFDAPPVDYDSWHFAGTADEALAQLDTQVRTWLDGVRALDDSRLAEQVGAREPAAFAHLTITDLVLHIHREAIHHGAEICLLRDLYAHQPGGTRPTA